MKIWRNKSENFKREIKNGKIGFLLDVELLLLPELLQVWELKDLFLDLHVLPKEGLDC